MNVDVEPLPTNKDVVRRLRRLQEASSDLKPAMREMAEYLMHLVENRFEFEGPSWAPLAPATVREREKRGYGPEHPILQRTRRLKDSVQPFVSAQAALVGTNLRYAATHQFGDRRQQRVFGERDATVTFPARPFLGWGPEDADEAIEIVAKHFRRAMRRRRGR